MTISMYTDMATDEVVIFPRVSAVRRIAEQEARVSISVGELNFSVRHLEPDDVALYRARLNREICILSDMETAGADG